MAASQVSVTAPCSGYQLCIARLGQVGDGNVPPVPKNSRWFQSRRCVDTFKGNLGWFW